MDYSLDISSKLPKSLRVRRSIIPLALLFVRYADMVRRHGILSLENDHREDRTVIVNPRITDIFHRSLDWIIDGYEAEFVRGNFDAIIQSRKWSSIERLALNVISEGVILIQQGYNPHSVENRLFCWIWFDLFEEYENEREKQKELSHRHWQENLDRFKIEFLSVQNERVLEAGYTDRILMSLDKSSFQRLLKELESYQIGRAMAGCRKETVEWYWEQISSQSAYYALDYMRSIISSGKIDLTEFETVLEKNVRNLLETGEIVLNREWGNVEEINAFLSRGANE